MAISNDLFLAILAMDAYNRGYNAGLGDTNTGLPGTQIGNATIADSSAVLVDGSGHRLDQAASFYAQSYTLDGKTVIAYRGTDAFGADLKNGYPTAWGMQSNQAMLAVDFYKAVLNGADPQTTNVTFTGHSLGGGLAGYVAALYGRTGVIFDQMPFTAAAGNAYKWATGTMVDPLSSTGYVSDPALKDRIYGSSQPWAVNYDAIKTFFIPVQGNPVWTNLLSSLRATTGADGQLPSTALNLPPDVNLSNSLYYNVVGERHDGSLIAIRMFLDGATATENWKDFARYFLPALFDQKLMKAVPGAEDIAVQPSSLFGNPGKDYAYAVRSALAYSAIDEGTRVFGDTGIRALKDDANDLGSVLNTDGLQKTLKTAADAISKIFVQYAGQLAIGKVQQSNSADAVNGVLKVLTTGSAGAIDALEITFADDVWKLGNSSGNATTNIVGRTELTDKVLSDGAKGANDIREGMQWLWNDSKSEIIDKITFAVTNEALTKTLDAHPVSEGQSASDKVGLFVAGGGADEITGSKDRDFIFGGDGNDVLDGAAGEDLLAGGGGNDTLHGGDDRDYLTGGNGDDKLYGEQGEDFLVGGNGNDTLNGGSVGGDDYLEGGVGDDLYIVDGHERINDADMDGRIEFSGIELGVGRQIKPGSNIYFGDHGEYYVKQGTSLFVQYQGQNVQIDHWSGNTGLGIELREYQEPTDKSTGTPPGPVVDPLVLDLNGDGITLTEVRGSNAFFDWEGDGFATRTGWVAPTDGLLAIDKNGNGTIDNTFELFGSETTDGFTVLAALDSNGDGKVDAADIDFANLLVWQDTDGDGITDAGELHALSDFGITGFSLETTPTENLHIADNAVPLLGTFTRSDGSTGAVGEVLFRLEPMATEWVRPDGFEVSELAGKLPKLAGHGLLADSEVLLTNNAGLATEFRDFIIANNGKPLADIRDGSPWPLRHSLQAKSAN